MTSQAHTPSLAEVLSLIESAMALLTSAEAQWEGAVERELAPQRTPEVDIIEELLQGATHETAGTLWFLLRDIEGLLAARGVRSKYPMFSTAQFDHIVSHGWSTRFVSELSKQHPEIALAELSGLVKNLCLEWGRLPRMACMTSREMFRGTPARDQAPSTAP